MENTDPQQWFAGAGLYQLMKCDLYQLVGEDWLLSFQEFGEVIVKDSHFQKLISLQLSKLC